jgi:L-ascorbate metabolism protein UlaG (beta-lactamase superfamily)
MIRMITGFKKSMLIISSMFLALALFSQEKPAVDRISTSVGTAEIHFIGHGTLMIIINGFVIHIDPVKSSGSYSGLPKADVILVTHEHGDHLDTQLIGELKKESTVMFCNAKSAVSVPWAKTMKPGDKEDAGKVSIEAVDAYNIKNVRQDGQPYHPKGDGNGYIITIGDKRIYIAGDTENTPEMKSLKNIDVAFLPMNLPYTMTPEMVADAAKAFKPAVLYPYHYGNTDTREIVNLLRDSGIEVRIRNLK